MEISKITSSGRLTIPIALRKKYNLPTGTKIIFIEQENRTIIQKLDKNYFTNLAGSLGENKQMLKSLVKDKLIERNL